MRKNDYFVTDEIDKLCEEIKDSIYSLAAFRPTIKAFTVDDLNRQVIELVLKALDMEDV